MIGSARSNCSSSTISWRCTSQPRCGAGYFALPILYGDQLVGKLDATADHKAGVLQVNAVHRDVNFTRAITAAVNREMGDLARWLDLDLMHARG